MRLRKSKKEEKCLALTAAEQAQGLRVLRRPPRPGRPAPAAHQSSRRAYSPGRTHSPPRIREASMV